MPEQHETFVFQRMYKRLDGLLDWWTQDSYDHYHEWLDEV